ncbi:MAG: type II secretion system protein M [Bacterioplanes sp.]|nr:type II secretion system protein M [Bacterioplanes sp.]
MNRWQALQEQWQQHPLIQSYRERYRALSTMEQRVVHIAITLLLFLLVYGLLIAPLWQKQQQADESLQRALATYNLIADNAHRFGGASTQAQAPLLSTVTQRARLQGVPLSRYEQDGRGLRIWIDRTPFDEAITLLEGLQQSGIQISQVTIDRTDSPGRVNIRATLMP